MPVHVRWQQEPAPVLLLVVEATWTWAEMVQAVDVIRGRLETDSAPTDLVVDLRTMVGLPPALFSHVRQLARDLPPARGRRIMVGLPPHLQRLLSVLLKLHPSLCRRYRVVDTLEEALYLLAHDDDPAFLNT